MERVELYTAVTPPGWEMRINVTPTAVHDEPPMHQEIRGVVVQLRNSRAADAMGMKAEHLKEWLRGTIKHEESENRVAGEGDCWRFFCAVDADSLGEQHHSHTDELDDNCPSPKRRGQLLLSWYWTAQPHVEGHGENHGSLTFSH
jgi:hypothetical protein